jgi:hypothetical protein
MVEETLMVLLLYSKKKHQIYKGKDTIRIFGSLMAADKLP